MPQASFFISGANAKLMVNHLPLAYATDVNYRISVRHSAPKVLGMYEAQEITPLTYDVTGSFTVVRYARGHKDIVDFPPKDVSNRGNGVGAWHKERGFGIPDTLGSPFGQGADEGRAHHSLMPSKLAIGMMFDMEVRQKLDSDHDCPFVRLRHCRITDADFTLTKRGVARQKFTFMARYADEDTFTADKSGIGQDLE